MVHVGAAAGDQTPPRLHVSVLFVSLLPVIEYPESHEYTTVSPTSNCDPEASWELLLLAAGGEPQAVGNKVRDWCKYLLYPLNTL